MYESGRGLGLHADNTCLDGCYVVLCCVMSFHCARSSARRGVNFIVDIHFCFQHMSMTYTRRFCSLVVIAFAFGL